MSLKCQQCGTPAPSGKFCPQCGGQLVPVAAAAMPQPPQVPPQQMPPQVPPQMPPQFRPPQPPQFPPNQFQPQPQPFQQQPASGGGKGWVKWAVIGAVAVLVIAGVALFLGSGDEGGGNVVDKGQPQQTNKDNQGQGQGQGQSQGSTKGTPTVKTVATGSLGSKATNYAAWGQYLAAGSGSSATLYRFDAAGKATKLNSVNAADAGKLVEVAVGDMFNTGSPFMVALFEKKAYFVPTSGEVTASPVTDGTKNVLIGDWDGDGKVETIYLRDFPDGTHGFDVWRYPAKDNTPIYSKNGVKNAFPVLIATQLKAGQNNLMMGYVWEGNTNLSVTLYNWDGVGGPVEMGRYPVANGSDAQWLSIGPTGLGPTLAITRGGSKPNLELYAIAKDGKSATSLGQMAPDGQGWPATLPSAFMGQGKDQLLAVDDTGKYFIYELSFK